MLDHSFAFKTISELVSAVRTQEISPVELVDLLLLRIAEIDRKVNSFLTLNPTAREEALEIERAVRDGSKTGPLCGIPISIKDIIHTKNLPTTAGSKVFGGGLNSERDADVVTKLRQAGAILIGKTNLHEFAYGITNENEHYGPVRNPWNLNHIAGGSSGGSAAAVVLGLCIGSIGTDTRGSIRIPCACCGATGLKPTLNTVSTEGVLPLSWTLDHVGPITTNVADTAILTGVISRKGNLVDRYQAALHSEIRFMKIGLAPYFFRHLDPAVDRAVQAALNTFEQGGARCVPIEINGLDEALEASDFIARAEAVTIHDSNLRKKPEGYGEKVKKRLLSGYEVTGVELVRAERIRLKTIESFRRAFCEVDCLAAPALPIPAPPLGTEIIRSGSRENGIVNEFVRLNAPQNVAGLPALAMPCGFTEESLPVAIQLITWCGNEELLLSLGAYFQRATDWHLARPPLSQLPTRGG